MYWKKKLLFILLICATYQSFAQITLEDCRVKAETNYPLINQYQLLEKISAYNLSNANRAYLPQIALSSKATYQSEVIELPMEIPNMKAMSKDQYNATLEINQIIWDGGVINSKKEIIKKTSEIEKKQLDVSLYALRERVNQLFFGVLLLDERIEQNRNLQKELERNHTKINSYIENGFANNTDLDVIRIEQLKAQQALIQLNLTRDGYRKMMEILIGEKISDSIEFIRPEIKEFTSLHINRPELDLFNLQKLRLDAQKNEIKANNMPKIGLFLTGGYGKPGLNMLKNEFSAYYMGGVRLTWNIANLYVTKTNNKIIESNKKVIDTQRDIFLFNTTLEVTQKELEIQKYKELLIKDEEIINLRKNVRTASEIKLQNGTYSINDLIQDINAEDMAKQDKIIHQIELLLSVYNLQYTTNNQ